MATVEFTFTNHSGQTSDADQLNNDRYVSVGDDGLRIWDQSQEYSNYSSTNFLLSVATISDTRIVAGDTAGKIIVVDYNSNFVREFNPHSDGITKIKRLSDTEFVTASEDLSVKTVDLNGNVDRTFSFDSQVDDVDTFGTDKISIPAQNLSGDRVIETYNYNDGSLFDRYTDPNNDLPNNLEVTDSDNKIVCSLDFGGGTIQYDPSTNSVDWTISKFYDAIEDASTDDQVVAGDGGGGLDLLEKSDGSTSDTLDAHGNRITSIHKDVNGKILSTATDADVIISDFSLTGDKTADLDINFAKNVSANSAGFNGDLNSVTGVTDADLGFIARRTDNNNVGDVFYSETQVDPNNISLPFNYDGSLPQLSEGVEYEARAILRDADANTFESDDSLTFATNDKVDLETLPTQQSDDDGAVVRGRVNDVNDASIDELELYFQIRETGTTSFDLQILVDTIQVDNIQFPITRENDVSILDSSTQFEYQFGAIDST